MATFRDWKTLAGTTIRSLNGRDVANLYEFEWPEARKTLLSEYSATLEAESNRVRRFIRSCSAIVYGLTKRLAPHRRVLFVIALLVTLKIAFEVTVTGAQTRSTSIMVVVSFVIMSFLLALELLDKLKFRDELELARELQAGLLPHTLPELARYELAAFNRIANTVGGDIYDFVALPDGRLAILFGDASGHGMAAGLVMAVAHAAFRTQLDIDPSPV
ncbi:MAG TPA: SpoIIE family protein phosphatase, partial [Thermoanaerobaculia bacterium]|nr:SpoIIE family protein phosphatase [Thermoanaerobaculia bacterium]